MLAKKHLVGVALSALLFAMFGMFVGFWSVVFGGVGYAEPFSNLATGPTPVPLTDVFDPLGLSPGDVGLSRDAALVLPAIPATIALGGLVIDLTNYTVAEVFGYGGAGFGTLVGLYYAIRIAYEEGQDETEREDAVPLGE
jgi:hypothetical protein